MNEQESSQLRRKVDELEQENKTIKIQVKELRDVPKTPTPSSKRETVLKDKEIAELQKKIVDMEKEMKVLRKNNASKVGTQTYQKLEEEKKKALQDIKEFSDQIDTSKLEISRNLLFSCGIYLEKVSLNWYFSLNCRKFKKCHCQARKSMHRTRENKW